MKAIHLKKLLEGQEWLGLSLGMEVPVSAIFALSLYLARAGRHIQMPQASCLSALSCLSKVKSVPCPGGGGTVHTRDTS